MENKLCSFCKEFKPLNEFYTSGHDKNKLRNYCKNCFIKVYYAPRKIQCECGKQITDKRHERHLQTDIHRRTMAKVMKCSHCKTEMAYDNFHRDKTSGDGLRCICKECQKKLFYKKLYKIFFL